MLGIPSEMTRIEKMRLQAPLQALGGTHHLLFRWAPLIAPLILLLRAA